MNIWIVILLCLDAMSLGVVAVRHGQKKVINFWHHLISVMIVLLLLYLGGLFG